MSIKINVDLNYILKQLTMTLLFSKKYISANNLIIRKTQPINAIVYPLTIKIITNITLESESMKKIMLHSHDLHKMIDLVG